MNQYTIQSAETETYPTPADMLRTLAVVETAEQAYDVYITEFRRLRSVGIRGRVSVLLNGTPVSLVPAPKKRR